MNASIGNTTLLSHLFSRRIVVWAVLSLAIVPICAFIQYITCLWNSSGSSVYELLVNPLLVYVVCVLLVFSKNIQLNVLKTVSAVLWRGFLGIFLGMLMSEIFCGDRLVVGCLASLISVLYLSDVLVLKVPRTMRGLDKYTYTAVSRLLLRISKRSLVLAFCVACLMQLSVVSWRVVLKMDIMVWVVLSSLVHTFLIGLAVLFLCTIFLIASDACLVFCLYHPVKFGKFATKVKKAEELKRETTISLTNDIVCTLFCNDISNLLEKNNRLSKLTDVNAAVESNASYMEGEDISNRTREIFGSGKTAGSNEVKWKRMTKVYMDVLKELLQEHTKSSRAWRRIQEPESADPQSLLLPTTHSVVNKSKTNLTEAQKVANQQKQLKQKKDALLHAAQTVAPWHEYLQLFWQPLQPLFGGYMPWWHCVLDYWAGGVRWNVLNTHRSFNQIARRLALEDLATLFSMSENGVDEEDAKHSNRHTEAEKCVRRRKQLFELAHPVVSLEDSPIVPNWIPLVMGLLLTLDKFNVEVQLAIEEYIMRRNKEKRKDMSRKSPVTKNPSDPAVKLDTPANAPSLQFKHHEVLFNEVLYRDDVVQANCGMWNAVRPQRQPSICLPALDFLSYTSMIDVLTALTEFLCISVIKEDTTGQIAETVLPLCLLVLQNTDATIRQYLNYTENNVDFSSLSAKVPSMPLGPVQKGNRKDVLLMLSNILQATEECVSHIVECYRDILPLVQFRSLCPAGEVDGRVNVAWYMKLFRTPLMVEPTKETESFTTHSLHYAEDNPMDPFCAFVQKKLSAVNSGSKMT